MVRLSLLILLAAIQEPAPPAWTADLVRLEALMEVAAPADPAWIARVFTALGTLEHAPAERVLRAWEMLAGEENDVGRANLILFQRRHRLPLEAVEAWEGPESTLERILALWGENRLKQTRAALEKAVTRYPEETRFQDNLLWLDLSPPGSLRLDATPRRTALAVLATRRKLHSAPTR